MFQDIEKTPLGLTRVAPTLEYFSRDAIQTVLIKDILVFPAQSDSFDFKLWKENVAEVKAHIASLTNVNEKRSKFWKFALEMFEKAEDVFEFFGTHPRLFIDTIKAAALPEIQDTKAGRAIALCTTHDNDGKILAQRCEAAGVDRSQVAVVVFDAHDDVLSSRGKSGAVRLMLDDNEFGKAVVIGLPTKRAESLNYSLDDVYSQMYDAVQDLSSFFDPLRDLSRSEFIQALTDIITWRHGVKVTGELAPPYTELMGLAISMSDALSHSYEDLARSRQIDRLNQQTKKVSFFGQEITKEDLRQTFVDMKRQGITHMLWSIDPDCFKLMDMRLTPIEYSNWGILALLGLPHVAGEISKQPRTSKANFIDHLFFGNYQVSVSGGSHDIAYQKNGICQFGGLSLEAFKEQVEMLRELAHEHGMTVGVQPRGNNGKFYGTVTELDPDAPDYNGNTAALVGEIARLLTEKTT